MKLTPRITLGIAVSVLILVILVGVIILKKNASYLLLTSDQNHFSLNFSIEKNDRQNFQNFLTLLAVPQEAKDGIQFQLDSTSSARLNFLTPIKANLNLKDKDLNFSGKTSIPVFQTSYIVDQIKVPNSTNLAIFAPDLQSFLKARLTLPQNISAWLNANLVENQGSYLFVYNSKPDFSLLVKKTQINFDVLKSLKDENGDPLYKEESSGDIQLHFLQIPQSDQEKQQTLTFFQLADYQVMSSSPAAAKQFIDAQKSSNPTFFPKEQNSSQASIVLEYTNSSNNQVSDQMETFLLQPWQGSSIHKSKLASSLKQIRNATFTLKERAFSGLINLK